VGCFLAGCCYGRPTHSALGVVFPDPETPAGHLCRIGGPIHPVQLYEAAGLLGIAALLVALAPRLARRPAGTLFLVYLVAYALLRLVTEHFRGDVVERGVLAFGLSTSQTIALAMVAAGLALAWLLQRRGEAT
jgi:phosphatidylglycerol:prolipoprotein diacylglycerol transferase